MLKKSFALICALTLALALGCGDEDDTGNNNNTGKVDQATATKAMTEAMTVGSQIFAQVSTELGKAAGTWLTPKGSGQYTVSGTQTNPQGGTATVTGTASKNGTAWKMDLTITFKDWNGSTGVTINGDLNLSYDITSLTAYKIKIVYTGALTVAGAGLTSFDMTITFNGPTSYSVCGTVGGYPVNQGNCPK